MKKKRTDDRSDKGYVVVKVCMPVEMVESLEKVSSSPPGTNRSMLVRDAIEEAMKQ